MAAALLANSSMACSCAGDICASPAGVQPLFGQVGQQGGTERVASAYAVAHRHWLRSDSELAVLPAEQLRAIATRVITTSSARLPSQRSAMPCGSTPG